MKVFDLEERMRQHAEIVKTVVPAPFELKREEIKVMKKRCDLRKGVVIAAAVLCLLGTGVFAAYRLMSAKEVANELGDTRLAENLEDEQIYDTVTDGEYKATVLGITSGDNLSDFKSSSWDIFSERTYAVVAVEKSDGSAMTYDDEILVTPLIDGLRPWQYNVFTMNGGYTAKIIDGVLYRIIEFDSIEYFADRNVYIAVLSESFLNNKSYSYDEKTGEISAKEDYDGTNILIKLDLDKSKADPKKAQEYLDKLNDKVETETDFEEENLQDDSEDVKLYSIE